MTTIRQLTKLASKLLRLIQAAYTFTTALVPSKSLRVYKLLAEAPSQKAVQELHHSRSC